MKAKTGKQRFRELQLMFNQGLNACIIELAPDYLCDFPKDDVAWLVYGKALADFARYKEARLALLRAIKYMPPEKSDLPYNYMGHLFEDQGDYRRAVEWYKKAIEESPEEARNFIFIGAVLVKAGNLSEAERYFRQAIKCKKGPVDEAYYNLGVILAGQGKYKSALVYFEKALKLDPRYKLAKQAHKDIERVLAIKETSNKRMQRRPPTTAQMKANATGGPADAGRYTSSK